MTGIGHKANLGRLFIGLFLSLTLCSASVSAIDAPRRALAQHASTHTRNIGNAEDVRIASHGAQLIGQLYRPHGAGLHPAVVLLHGFPGDEHYLDLPPALQQAGWTVITIHYRGLSGSGGKFSFKSGVEDVGALLDQLRQPELARAWGIDPSKVVVMGHSY